MTPLVGVLTGNQKRVHMRRLSEVVILKVMLVVMLVMLVMQVLLMVIILTFLGKSDATSERFVEYPHALHIALMAETLNTATIKLLIEMDTANVAANAANVSDFNRFV